MPPQSPAPQCQQQRIPPRAGQPSCALIPEQTSHRVWPGLCSTGSSHFSSSFIPEKKGLQSEQQCRSWSQECVSHQGQACTAGWGAAGGTLSCVCFATLAVQPASSLKNTKGFMTTGQKPSGTENVIKKEIFEVLPSSLLPSCNSE